MIGTCSVARQGCWINPPKAKHVWIHIPDEVRRKVGKLALKETELSPRELGVIFTAK